MQIIKVHKKVLRNSMTTFKGCDSNFEVNIFQFFKVATNETSTLHLTICTRIALETYNNNEQQFNRHDFLKKFSLII